MILLSTAQEVMDAVNARLGNLVTVSLFTGNDGTGHVGPTTTAFLTGGTASNKASLNLDPSGSVVNDKLTFTAARVGTDGNKIAVRYDAPSSDTSVLDVLLLDSTLIVVQLG